MQTNAPLANEVEWIVGVARAFLAARDSRQSCVWTSCRLQGVVCLMDDDTAELISLLCTRAGMIMEDASVMALTIGQAESDDRHLALLELQQAADRINALIGAARALLDW